MYLKITRKIFALSFALAVASLLTDQRARGSVVPEPNSPVKVEIQKVDGRYQLFVNHQPFFIKGAGLDGGDQEKLAEHGGNSFRTWRAGSRRESGRQMLDRALKNHLYVAMGLDLGLERHGFNYDNEAMVAAQLAKVKSEVLQYKDHPAVIIWIIGNELNLDAHNPKVWNAVNDISKMIHQVDPNHLTCTALAGISKDMVNQIKTRAPDLDLLSFQMYGDIVNLPRYLRETGWDGPYIVSEWGATGHWEVPKTDWGAPIENDSTAKADAYKMRYEKAIASDTKQCLGSYVFLWGQKQERTPTWYGMFLSSGEETATVDVLHYLWNGSWPANRSPRLNACTLDSKTAYQNVRLKAGETYSAKVSVTDDDHDAVTYSWEILPESTNLGNGGDYEPKPARIPGLIVDPKRSEIKLKAPAKPGAYRLFVYAYDGKGHAAHANIPFFVNAPAGPPLSSQ